MLGLLTHYFSGGEVQLDRMSSNLLFQMGCILNCSSQNDCVGLELRAMWKLQHKFLVEWYTVWNYSHWYVPTSIPCDSLVQISWKVMYHSRRYHWWTVWERSRNKFTIATQQMPTYMKKLLGAWNSSGRFERDSFTLFTAIFPLCQVSRSYVVWIHCDQYCLKVLSMVSGLNTTEIQRSAPSEHKLCKSSKQLVEMNLQCN